MNNTVSLTLGNLTFTLDASDEKQLFKDLAHINEIFGHTKCGKCGSEDLSFVVRSDDDGNDYYELKCNKCGAKFKFGQAKKGGTLFPKRKDADGNWLNDGGWLKYNKNTGKEE